jgi:putative nucleotidyltransferase with HDIG domain
VERENVEKAILRLRELPTLPSVLGKILSTAADPDASALDLGKHIAGDQSLSATLLRLVNSAYYGFPRQIDTVIRAIVMLGFFEVRNVALTATTFNKLSGGGSSYDRVQLWRHSLATAITAEHAARELGIPAEGCFEAGLLHDIGKVALDHLYGMRYVEAALQAHERGCFVREVEAAEFGMDHARAGEILCEHWNLPASVVATVRNHHDPTGGKDNIQVTHLTTLADYITYQANLGEWGNGIPPEFPEEAAQNLNVSQDQCAEMIDKLAGDHEKIDDFVGALHG